MVVDAAREPFKPVAPDLPLYLAITLFSSAWLALGGALLLDALRPGEIRAKGAAAGLILLLMATEAGYVPAPTPNT